MLGLVGSQATFCLRHHRRARPASFGATPGGAVTEGVQATWLALGGRRRGGKPTATPLVSAIASDDGITAAALPWLDRDPGRDGCRRGGGWLRVRGTMRRCGMVPAGPSAVPAAG